MSIPSRLRLAVYYVLVSLKLRELRDRFGRLRIESPAQHSKDSGMQQVGDLCLWIGNCREARDFTLIQSEGFQAVVDLAYEEPVGSPSRDVTLLRVPIIDGTGNSRLQLELVVSTVQRCLELKLKTLVACSYGMSRSPLIVSAAMARMQGVTFQNALEIVSSIRKVDCSPALYQELNALSSSTE